ncbi:MAG: hypothetical protein RID81_06825 [Sandaracinaceae bacterium]
MTDNLDPIALVPVFCDAATSKIRDGKRAEFRVFLEDVRARLELGRVRHGDGSFDLPLEEILGRVQRQATDAAGWAFVAWAGAATIDHPRAAELRARIIEHTVGAFLAWRELRELVDVGGDVDAYLRDDDAPVEAER